MTCDRRTVCPNPRTKSLMQDGSRLIRMSPHTQLGFLPKIMASSRIEKFGFARLISSNRSACRIGFGYPGGFLTSGGSLDTLTEVPSRKVLAWKESHTSFGSPNSPEGPFLPS